MGDTRTRKFQKDLNGGLMALVLLALIDNSSEDLHGYEIARRLQRSSPGEPLLKNGTIYPVLRSLCAQGLLASRLVPSAAGPARRCYRITDEGRAALAAWRRIWWQTRDFVDRFTCAGAGA